MERSVKNPSLQTSQNKTDDLSSVTVERLDLKEKEGQQDTSDVPLTTSAPAPARKISFQMPTSDNGVKKPKLDQAKPISAYAEAKRFRAGSVRDQQRQAEFWSDLASEEDRKKRLNQSSLWKAEGGRFNFTGREERVRPTGHKRKLFSDQTGGPQEL